MANKILKSRVILKHDIEENWLKATNFIPLRGEVVVYDPDNTYDYARFKIGDGITQADGTVVGTKVNDLPFVTDNIEIPTPDVSGQIAEHNTSGSAHNDIRQIASKKYTKPENGIPKTDLASDVQASLAKADTALQEIPSEYVTDTELNAKGYLTEHQSLAGYATEEWVEGKKYLTEVPSEYITETELNNKNYLTSYTETDPTVPAWAKAESKPSYNLGEVTDTSNYVRMTPAERAKLSGVADGANKYIHPDTHDVEMITGLAKVATSGQYSDLSGVPTSMTPTEHDHSIDDVTGLQDALDSKAPTHNHPYPNIPLPNSQYNKALDLIQLPF